MCLGVEVLRFSKFDLRLIIERVFHIFEAIKILNQTI